MWSYYGIKFSNSCFSTSSTIHYHAWHGVRTNISLEDEEDNGEVNIFDAEDPKHKKLEYAIFFNQKIKITQVSKLYVEVFKKLFEIQPETFFTTDLGERIVLTKNQNKTVLRQAVSINDTYFIESNIDNKGKFDRIKQALTIFEFEDELIIKYAPY